ncbi:MAG: 30S ribosomal protein S9 [Candidatus Diapherotrites archaeon]
MTKKKKVVVRAKKKEAVARAIAKAGKGRITINKRNIETIKQKYFKALIKEPLMLAEDAVKNIDIIVNVKGGGATSQIMASRGAIAKAIIEYLKDEKLKKKFLAYDRMLLVDDARRVEPKKQLGPKARRKKQKSKR